VGGNTWEVRWWNVWLPNAEQYTKLEHSKANNCNAFEMRWWNRELPKADQYTIEEINLGNN